MAPNVTVSFWAANDINGTPILTIDDEDTYFKGLTLQPDLYSLGGWQLTLGRAWGFELLGSGATDAEVFVRFMVHAFSDTTWYYGGVLNKRSLTVVQQDEIGAEDYVIGGSGPKAYMDRSALGIEQRSGLGFNLVLENGVWRWNEAATAGRILDAVADEDAARPNPSLPDLTIDFNDTNDSDGNPWTNEVTPGNGEYETPIGSSLLDVIWDLEDLAELTTTVHLGTLASPQYELNAFQSFGDDNTGSSFGAGIGLLREGVNIANDSLTVEGVGFRKASHVIVEGKEGVWVTEVRPTWSPGDYVKWAKIDYTRSSSETILHRAGLRWLQRQTNGDQELTIEIVPGASPSTGYYFPAPNDPIWLGNTISVDTVADGSVHSPLDYNNADALVTALELALGPAGDDTSADAQAKSWDIKVKLNGERASDGGSPNQSSASTPGSSQCQCPHPAPACTGGGGTTVTTLYNHVNPTTDNCLPGTYNTSDGDPFFDSFAPAKAVGSGGSTDDCTDLDGGGTHSMWQDLAPGGTYAWSIDIADKGGVATGKFFTFTEKDAAETTLATHTLAIGTRANYTKYTLSIALGPLHANYDHMHFTWPTFYAKWWRNILITESTATSPDDPNCYDYPTGTTPQDPGNNYYIPAPIINAELDAIDERIDAVTRTHTESATDPTVTDDDYTIGTIWINTTDDTVWVLTDDAAGAAVWVDVSETGTPGSSTGVGELLIADTGTSTPLVFADLLQNEAQDDLVYGDP